MARAEYRKGAHVPAGDGGGLSARSGRSPTVAGDPRGFEAGRAARILPRARMKVMRPEFDSTLASDAGTSR